MAAAVFRAALRNLGVGVRWSGGLRQLVRVLELGDDGRGLGVEARCYSL
jgi:hypothetical protein